MSGEGGVIVLEPLGCLHSVTYDQISSQSLSISLKYFFALIPHIGVTEGAISKMKAVHV